MLVKLIMCSRYLLKTLDVNKNLVETYSYKTKSSTAQSKFTLGIKLWTFLLYACKLSRFITPVPKEAEKYPNQECTLFLKHPVLKRYIGCIHGGKFNKVRITIYSIKIVNSAISLN